MVLIGIPLTLLAILGAMHLLAKAQKEGLHDIFKYTSYFVLTICIFTLSLFLIKSFDKGKKDRKIKIMKDLHHEMGMPDGHDKDVMFFRHNGDGPEVCPHSGKPGCCMENGKTFEKKIIITDSVVKK